MHWQRSLLTAEKPTRAVLEVFLQEKEKAGVKGSRFLENEVGGVRPDSRAHGSVSAGEPAILPQHAPEPEWNTPVPSFVLTEAPHARTAVSEALLPATAMPMEKTESSLEAAISPAAGAKGCMAPCPWGVNGTSILVARHPIQKSKSSSPLGCELCALVALAGSQSAALLAARAPPALCPLRAVLAVPATERGHRTVLPAGCHAVRTNFQMGTSRVKIQPLRGTKALLTDCVSHIPARPQVPREDKARDSGSQLWKCWGNLKDPSPPQQLTETAWPTEPQHPRADLRTRSPIQSVRSTCQKPYRSPAKQR